MKMSAAVLARIQQRATQTDQLITQLRAQLNTLKKAAAVEACRREENQLAVENQKLRQDVCNMREKLVAAETRNGVKSVPLPSAQKPAGPKQPTVAMGTGGQSKPPADTNKQLEQAKKKKEKQEKRAEAKKETKPQPEAATIDVSRLNMRIGHIRSAKKHPDADGLYVEEVDLGEEQCRTIVSGLVQHVPLEKMQDRLAIFLINLKPAKMRGILSQGMIMCASSPALVEIIDPPAGATIGDRITVHQFPGEADALLNPKKKVWEAIQPDLQVDAAGVATYRGSPWIIEGKGECKAPTARSQGIK